MEKRPKETCKIMIDFYIFELSILPARSKLSPPRHENPDADKGQDYTKADKDETINDERTFLRLPEPGTLMPPRGPSTHDENQTQMIAEPEAHPPGEEFYVRALKPSEPGSKLRFDKGNVLRVVWKGTEDGEGSQSFAEMVALQMPAESGRAFWESFEEVDREVAEEVERKAGVEKEKKTFLRVMEWDDGWR